MWASENEGFLEGWWKRFTAVTALTYAEFQVHLILSFSTVLMWISEDAAKTSVRADISCQVFAYTETETWKRVSLLRASFLSFILKCSFARKHFWEALGIARLQSKYNLGNKTPWRADRISMGKYTDRDVVDERRSCHGFRAVFSLLNHLSLSRKHRLKTLQIGLNLSSYLWLKEGKKAVVIEVNIKKKKLIQKT